ncbi:MULTISPECIES: ROK family protein [Fusobacterium]|uniref:ROK family protein n=1 Tax=Fusobacterium TaxID=848 RepID=UPI001476F46F|nr:MULTISPECIES: ROK family protein [Fusobacterium]NME36656.1 ROK family protein [Fusobacterium sp. FSA-380-WT-3A]
MYIKLDSLKKLNRGLILSSLKNNNFTRVELQKRTGLAAGTLSNIMKELVLENIILEIEENGNGIRGRKGTKLFINYNYKYVIGIKIKRGILIGSLNSLDGTTINQMTLEIPDKSPSTVVDLIIKTFKELKQEKSIIGIGIAFPGQVDSNEGIITYSAFYQWKKVKLKELLQKSIECEIFIENDVRAMALSEKDFISPDIKNMLYINIDRGVSCGIIINNSLLLGDNFVSGQLGHSFVENNGKICNCGKIGCLETITTNPRMLEDYLKEINYNFDTNEVPSFDFFINKVIENDPVALKIFNHAIYSLAIIIGNLSNTLNISTIVVGGDITKCNNLFFQTFFKFMSLICIPYVTENLNIKKSVFEHNDNTIGAVYIVLNQFFKGNIL